jgi:tRNA-modifying protein YgfZ
MMIDLSARAKFRLTGPDRVRYLNGQVTNNVTQLKTGQACYALVANHKGRLEGEIVIRAIEGALLVDAPAELREPLFARLGRYLIADDCELEDVTEEFALYHQLCSEPDAPSIIRYGPPGQDLWCPAGSPPPNEAALLSPSAVEALRLSHGVPAWPWELMETTLPHEAGLENRAVSFHKGCYVGQEVISRVESAGKVGKKLHHFRSSQPVARGWSVALAAEPDTPLGTLTSAAPAPDGTWHALGYLPRRSEGALDIVALDPASSVAISLTAA